MKYLSARFPLCVSGCDKEFPPLEKLIPFPPIAYRVCAARQIALERQQQQLAVAEEAERKANGNAMTERRAAYEKAKEEALALGREQARAMNARCVLCPPAIQAHAARGTFLSRRRRQSLYQDAAHQKELAKWHEESEAWRQSEEQRLTGVLVRIPPASTRLSTGSK